MSATRRSGRDQVADPQESQLRAIIDHVADGIVIVGEDGLVRFVNPAAEQLFGRSAADLLDQPFGVPLVADGTVEIDVVRRGGGTAVAELRVAQMEWQGERVFLVSLRDITDRKEAEERRRELVREQAARSRAEAEERRFRFLADVSKLLDSSLDYQRVLSQVASLLVTTRSELPSRDLPLPVPARLADWCVIDILEMDGSVGRVAAAHWSEEKELLLERLRREFPPELDQPSPAAVALRTREAVLHSEVDASLLARLARDARHRELLESIGVASVMAVPLVARGQVLGVLTFVRETGRYGEADLNLARDLAQRAALAISNARHFREAQEANRAKSDFLAVMSHELRTPLNAIMGYTDLLLAGISGPLTARQQQQLRRVEASSRHLLEIVEDILVYARMEAGREELRVGRVELGALLREVESMVRTQAEQKRLRLVLVEPRHPVVLETDPGKLRQILLNLVSNAVKFTETGEVRVEAHSDGAGHHVRVIDTGVGIPAEFLEKIFEPFWQVEQTMSRSFGGTGLGLSVARRLAQLLGGSLTAESRVGHGSTFTLWLPDHLPHMSPAR